MQDVSPCPSYRYSQPDQWRQFPDTHRDKVCSHKTIEGFGEFRPVLTNGVVVEALVLHSQAVILIHLDQVQWPKDTPIFMRRPKQPAKPARTKRTLTLEDLL